MLTPLGVLEGCGWQLFRLSSALFLISLRGYSALMPFCPPKTMLSSLYPSNIWKVNFFAFSSTTFQTGPFCQTKKATLKTSEGTGWGGNTTGALRCCMEVGHRRDSSQGRMQLPVCALDAGMQPALLPLTDTVRAFET